MSFDILTEKNISRMKNDTLKVCDKQCDQCLYSKNKIVSDTRRDELLYHLEQVNDYFICHKASIVNERVMCRGFYEKHKHHSLLIKLGKELGLLIFVNVMDIMKTGINKIRSQKIKTLNNE